MKKSKKFFSELLIGGVLLGLFNLTGCSFFANNKETPQGFSPIRLEKLEDNVDTVVEDYFKEKYGVEATVTYKNIAGGVFLGPDPSSVQYYLVTVNIEEEGVENEYYVEVHGREVEGHDELYVKKDAYYGKVIKERMEEWIDRYVDNTNIVEHYSSFFSATTNLFSSEYDMNYSAEDIIKSVSIIDDNKERPDLTLYIIVPQNEYEKNNNIESELLNLKSHIKEINGKVKIVLNIYADGDYYKKLINENYDCRPIKQIKLID